MTIHQDQTPKKKVIDEGRAITRTQLCYLEGLTYQTYKKLVKAGFGPQEESIQTSPRTFTYRISPEARRAWKEANKQRAASPEAEQIRQRVSKKKAEAGKASAKSPNAHWRKLAEAKAARTGAAPPKKRGPSKPWKG